MIFSYIAYRFRFWCAWLLIGSFNLLTNHKQAVVGYTHRLLRKGLPLNTLIPLDRAMTKGEFSKLLEENQMEMPLKSEIHWGRSSNSIKARISAIEGAKLLSAKKVVSK